MYLGYEKNIIVLYLIENDNNFINNLFIIKYEKKIFINLNNNLEYI